MDYFSRKNLHAVDKFLITRIIIIDVAVLPSVGDRLQLHDMMSIKSMKMHSVCRTQVLNK